MAGQVKPLSRTTNNELWLWFCEIKLNEAIGRNLKNGLDEITSTKKAKLSVNNYKNHLRKLENKIQKDFKDVSLNEITNLEEEGISFIFSFYRECIRNRKMIPTDIEVIISLV